MDLQSIILRYFLFYKTQSGSTAGENTIFQRITNHIKYLFPEYEQYEYSQLCEATKSIIDDLISKKYIQPHQIKTFFFEFSLTDTGIELAGKIADSEITNQFIDDETKFNMFLNIALKGINIYSKITYGTIGNIVNDALDIKLKIPIKEQRRIGDPYTPNKLFDFLRKNGFLKETDENEYRLNKRGKKLIEIGGYDKFIEWEYKRKKIEDEREIMNDLLAKSELATVEMQRTQVKINIWIAVGTILGSIYAIIQIIQGVKSIEMDRKSTIILLVSGIILGMLVLYAIQQLSKKNKK